MIINADDFGYSHEVNAAVAQCFREGRINRATLLVNMPGTEEAVRMAQEEGFFDKVGLHINLTEGYPLTQFVLDLLCAMPPVSLRGRFTSLFKARLYLNKATREAIRQEVEAQVQRYLAWALPCSTPTPIITPTPISACTPPYGNCCKRMAFARSASAATFRKIAFPCPFTCIKLFNALLRRLKTHGTPVGTTAYFGSVQDFEKSKNSG